MSDKTSTVFNIFSLLKKLAGLNQERLKNMGFNPYEAMILFNIYENKCQTQKDLVEKLNTPKQTVNSIVMGLKERDLIEMTVSSEDKRAKMIMLTDDGYDEIKKIKKYLSISDKRIFEEMGDVKLKEIEANLSELTSVIENIMTEEDI